MIAIIIPFYKITFFEATLKSLANQTDKRFKVYIGDDASPDNPEYLLEKYKGKFEFIYHRFEINLGGVSLTQQWGRCIALSANEEWIMILGDDDFLGENVVEEFYQELEEINKQDISVLRYATYKIDGKGEFISRIYEHPKIENSIDFLFRKTRSSLSEYVFRKKEVITIGFKDFPLGWCSDKLGVLEFSNFKNIFSINSATIFIRISVESISGTSKFMVDKNIANFNFNDFLKNNLIEKLDKDKRKVLISEWVKSYVLLENDVKKQITLIYAWSNLGFSEICFFIFKLIYYKLLTCNININEKNNL